MTSPVNTPQDAMNEAHRLLASTNSSDRTRMAELGIMLADAQARLHQGRQAEVTNLLAVGDSHLFKDVDRQKANARVLELLGIA
jgi:hypothetical protein